MQDTINIEGILEDLKPLMEFNHFFLLPGNEEIKGFFWQDADGNSVDCNIYQPKYGGVTEKFYNPKTKEDVNNFRPFEATPFEYRTVYRFNGKNISCKWHLECVCVDGQKFYSKDRIEIFKKPFSVHQQRYASTNEDFESLYQREIAAANYKDSKSFREYLIAKISEMKTLEQSLPAKIRKRSLELQDLSDRFLKWIKENKLIDGTLPGTFIKNNFDHVSTVEIYNHFKQLVDKKFLSEPDLIKYLKNAFEIKVPPGKLFKLTGVSSKKNVYKIFHKYYKEKASKPQGKAHDYAGLLGCYFDGYDTKTILSNWTKY